MQTLFEDAKPGIATSQRKRHVRCRLCRKDMDLVHEDGRGTREEHGILAA